MDYYYDRLPGHPDFREAHRRDFDDLQWASRQPIGDPKYKTGDVVEFHVGGFGVIAEVLKPHDGWPASYSTCEIKGLPYHKTRKNAWHYEGDFKTWVAKSPLHSLSLPQPEGTTPCSKSNPSPS